MNNPFKQSETKKRAKKALYRVERLNPDKGITSSLKIKEDTKEYIVCLCLTNRVVYTSFPYKYMAINQMQKYRKLYKKIEYK